jgi:hypothetical protein
VVVSLARTMGRLLQSEPPRPSAATELEALPFPDLARKTVASLAALLDAEGTEREALRAEFREMLAPRAVAEEPAVFEAPGPGLARVLQLLGQDPAPTA